MRGGRKIAWIGLALLYELLLRASELFAGEGGRVHQVYCLRRGDIARSGDRKEEGEWRN